MKTNKDKNQSRMAADINDTSRTMKPGKGLKGETTSQNSTSSPNVSGSGSATNIPSSQGRGWHGDSEGHAKAGSQSHKNTGKDKS